MGYYSEVAATMTEREDSSALSSRQRLALRIEMLYEALDCARRNEFGAIKGQMLDCRFSEEDLKYALPIWFHGEETENSYTFDERTCLKAISIAEHKLTLETVREYDYSNVVILFPAHQCPGQTCLWSEKPTLPGSTLEKSEYAA